MTPERYRQVVSLFQDVVGVSAEARKTILDARCEEDPDLRVEVEAMLEQDERRSLLRTAGGFEVGVAALHDATDKDAAPVPEQLGPYRILEVLGRGGMGTVYRAEQQQPRRDVALKTIHWWLLSPSAIERFRFEAQSLAQLQHPGIPQVYEVTEDVQHLAIAMELVEGPSLTDSVASFDGALPPLLELLARIADAVHHAHLRGLVHRDLKPDNVRVDATGQPKVLDFGIAQAVGADGKADVGEEVSGTLAYMAPEQLSPGQAIDIRADVYALGVMAYELISGARPFSVKGLPFDEARAMILSQQPAPLTSKGRPVPAALEHIVRRAMARAPGDRYASAADFAAELRRFLRHEPVHAHPGGRLYRTGRFVRRHRLAVALAAGVVLALVTGAATSFTLYRQAVKSQVQAERARSTAELARADAEAARDRATDEAAKAEATVGFLEQLLLSAAPDRSRGRTVTVLEALDKAASRLESQSLENPDVEVAVRLMLAQAYRSLGQDPPMLAQAEEAAKLAASGTLKDPHGGAMALLALADVKNRQGERAIAREAMGHNLRIEREAHPDAAHPHLAHSLYVAGQIEAEDGAFQAADALFAESFDIGSVLLESGEIPVAALARALNQRGHLAAHRGDYTGAEAFYRKGLELYLGEYGPGHLSEASSLHNLAWLALESGRPADALPHVERSMELRVAAMGPKHPRVGLLMALHAAVRLELGEIDEAKRIATRALRVLTDAHGPEHPVVVQNLGIEGRLLREEGRFVQAEAVARKVLAQHVSTQGPDHWTTAGASVELARVLIAKGDRTGARSVLEPALSRLLETVGPDARSAREARSLLAGLSAQASEPPR